VPLVRRARHLLLPVVVGTADLVGAPAYSNESLLIRCREGRVAWVATLRDGPAPRSVPVSCRTGTGGAAMLPGGR
jgi:hypothetical protein